MNKYNEHPNVMIEDFFDLKLSHREKQVLKLVAQGNLCKEISQQLRISETTVITYKNRLKGKLGVQSSYELIYKATKMGII